MATGTCSGDVVATYFFCLLDVAATAFDRGGGRSRVRAHGQGHPRRPLLQVRAGAREGVRHPGGVPPQAEDLCQESAED